MWFVIQALNIEVFLTNEYLKLALKTLHFVIVNKIEMSTNSLLSYTVELSTLISLIGTCLARNTAHHLCWLDKPGQRKIHAKSIPLLGGIAIYVAFLAASFIFNRHWFLSEGYSVLIGATVIVGVGLYDDVCRLDPLPKLLGQTGAAIAIILGGIQANVSGIYWLDMGITLFWIVGICNAVNLLDNMDGLSGGVTAIACLFLGAIALSQGQVPIAIVCASLFGATLGFLWFNWHPATIFMGDAGSLLLGFILAVLGLMIGFPTDADRASWLIPLFVLTIPIFDTTLVTISRLRRGIAIADGGKDHTSHRLVGLGLNVRQAVMRIYLAAFLCGMGAILAALVPIEGVDWAIAVLLAIVAVVALFRFEQVDLSNTGQTSHKVSSTTLLPDSH